MQDDELIQIEGTIENIVYTNEQNGYTVLELSSGGALITAVGELGGVAEGEEITASGVYVTHASFGKQFKVSTYSTRLPDNVEDIARYLGSGALPYIGPALAKRIVEKFKDSALDVIATAPDKLATVKGITLAKAKAISVEFARRFNVREAVTWLTRYGVSAHVATEMYKVFGEHTVQMVSHNPYLLCAHANMAFKIADDMAAELQIDAQSDCRLSAAILYVLRHNLANGHSCLPKPKLCATATQFIHVEPELVTRRLEHMIEEDELACAYCNSREYIYLIEYYKAEYNIAAHLRELEQQPLIDSPKTDELISANEALCNITYAPAQKEAIRAALERRCLVLTGGPGTGKTTTVNGIIACFEARKYKIELAAPTGRAAKRLSELTSRKAQTIHRLLEVDYSRDGTVQFIHNENNKLKCDVVVIDEMSMVDSLLFDSLLCALRPTCRIIMVGDEDQLPSVGAGNVLGSIITSELVSVVRLHEIFRQAQGSLIVSNAHRIVSGEVPMRGGKDSDFFIMEKAGEEAALLVCDLVMTRLPAAYKYDAISDIQVLCPTKLGILGTTSLNLRLQQTLNAPSQAKAQIEAHGRIYRVGDKVMQIKNNYDIQFRRDNGEDGVGAFNGDMGIIETVSPKAGTIMVKSEDRRIEYTHEQLRELELAYAVTIHKSQGSEFRCVVMPIADVPLKLCYRNLLYTGVTRARNLCIILGRAEEVSRMTMNVQNNLRYSCLSSFLKEGKEGTDK